MKRIPTAIAIGLCALLLLGCTAPQIINSDREQEKIQIVGEVIHATPTPEPTEEPAQTEDPADIHVSDPATPEPTEEPTPTPTPNRTEAEAFCDTAEALMDVPYHRGGTDAETGFDPGGFVYYCLNASGVKVRHKTSKGYSEVTDWQRVDAMDDLEVGDLCFFRTPGNDAVNCVTIYLGDGQMIYPSSGEGKVITAKIHTAYWEEAFVFARRVF